MTKVAETTGLPHRLLDTGPIKANFTVQQGVIMELEHQVRQMAGSSNYVLRRRKKE